MATWRSIPGHEGYEVSDEGGVRPVGGEPLSQSVARYAIVSLRGFGSRRVHRLVALAFIPNPDGKPFINHIDGQKRNNVVANLEWCTQSENMQHAVRIGLMDRNIALTKSGVHARRKLSPSDIERVVSAPPGLHRKRALARELGVTMAYLNEIKRKAARA